MILTIAIETYDGAKAKDPEAVAVADQELWPGIQLGSPGLHGATFDPDGRQLTPPTFYAWNHPAINDPDVVDTWASVIEAIYAGEQAAENEDSQESRREARRRVRREARVAERRAARRAERRAARRAEQGVPDPSPEGEEPEDNTADWIEVGTMHPTVKAVSQLEELKI